VTVAGVFVTSGTRSIQLQSKPSVLHESWRRSVPAASVTPVTSIVVYESQPPVAGTESGPATTLPCQRSDMAPVEVAPVPLDTRKRTV